MTVCHGAGFGRCLLLSWASPLIFSWDSRHCTGIPARQWQWGGSDLITCLAVGFSLCRPCVYHTSCLGQLSGHQLCLSSCLSASHGIMQLPSLCSASTLPCFGGP